MSQDADLFVLEAIRQQPNRSLRYVVLENGDHAFEAAGQPRIPEIFNDFLDWTLDSNRATGSIRTRLPFRAPTLAIAPECLSDGASTSARARAVGHVVPPSCRIHDRADRLHNHPRLLERDDMARLVRNNLTATLRQSNLVSL
jgi:hypothetical protein